jgi:acetyl-CoA carboxylase biotin carboxyl carrier protein
MTLNEVKELIELVAEKGFAEFEVEHSGFKLKIVAQGHASASLAAAPTAVFSEPAPAVRAVTAELPASTPAAAQPADDANLVTVKSPIVGTFYRASSPTAEPFVKIGDNVEAGTVLCIVEAMKLMNEIESEHRGEIVKIFVENGEPVEYDQPLFAIRV